MSVPTHVYVGHSIDCKKCGGTGLVQYGFRHGPNGPICPDCRGAKLTHEAMTLEDFAALFTWGQTFTMGGAGVEGMTQDIRVKDGLVRSNGHMAGKTKE